MEVTANGFPKAGNHALVKGLQLLGVNCSVQHIPFADGVPEDRPHVFIRRDPRNIVCSWLTHMGKPVTQGMFIAHLHKFEVAPFAEELTAFAGWLDDARTIHVRYEDLVYNAQGLKDLAGKLGVPYLDDAYPNLPGMTVSWQKKHANWAEIWGPPVEHAWNSIGGPRLLERWGY